MTKNITYGMVIIVLTFVTMASAFTTSASAHNIRIPNYVMNAARMAASINGHARCGWTSWTHQHIRCRMTLGSAVGYLTIHRIYGHRYLAVGTVYGTVIYRKYMTF
jgi:hypothetical protein